MTACVSLTGPPLISYSCVCRCAHDKYSMHNYKVIKNVHQFYVLTRRFVLYVQKLCITKLIMMQRSKAINPHLLVQLTNTRGLLLPAQLMATNEIVMSVRSPMNDKLLSFVPKDGMEITVLMLPVRMTL